MNDYSIFPDNESFALYLAGPFISAFLAYYGLHFALAVMEWVIDRGAALLESIGNRFGGGDGGGSDDDFEGYADMELPQIEGLIATEGKPSLHRRSA